MTDEPKLDLAFVQAPRCDGCGEPMVKHDATRWICNNDECDQNTTPVRVSGVYPFTVINTADPPPVQRLACTLCGAVVSTDLPGDVIVRAALTCPDCAQAERDLEAELKAERERWAKLERKVADTMAMVTKSKDASQARLILRANSLKAAGCQEHEQATGEALLAVDEMRRAYAIYDALRSVQIWMKGYL